ncbi:glycosyltransferase [Marinobacterium sp. xm-d-530]|uniref:glycosyltransferase n=1 Tax=Marinobacterium sp. xm-d-530 TaxID=2497747 RepID=UPI00156A3D64|nr:glycosyltransferase [Marinobacterium sp. xm-d-530]NRQ01175.1 putative glycosyl transferase [Marinobacterium sp. xm-d-530]
MNANRLLHLSHSDIRVDSRILKEMGAAARNGFVVSGVGLEDESPKSHKSSALDITSIRVKSRRYRYIPKGIRALVIYLEIVLRVFPLVRKVRPDVVHCNDFIMLPLAYLFKFAFRYKLVYDAHELESNRNGLSEFKGRLIYRLERWFWSAVDGLVVVSPSIDTWYQTNIGSKLSTVVMNSPVYSDNATSDKQYLRDKFSIPRDATLFIYVGLLMRGRGLDLVLEAFEDHPSSHLVFLGGGEYSERIKLIASKSANIHVHDPVEHSRVVEVARSADVGLCLIQNVSLSDYYCLPNKLFEYAFSGIPVLASNFPDIAELVGDYSLGVCVDLSVSSISDGIGKFESGLIEFSPQPINLDELSWGAQERKLISLYNQVIEG